MALPSTLITLQQFIGIQDSKGQFKTFNDIYGDVFVDNLYNSEVLGAQIVNPNMDVIGDNIILEIQEIPGVTFLDEANPKNNTPKMNRVIANLSTDYWGQLTFDVRDKRSAYAWSDYVGGWMGGLYKRYSDQNNLIVMEAMINTCLSFGNYIILPSFGGVNYSKSDYFDASTIAVRAANKIATTRSAFNLGQEPGRMRVISSYDAYQNIIVGQAFISAANLALEQVQSGKAGNVFGYQQERTMYLGQLVNQTNTEGEDLYARTYDFTNYSGLIYSVDSILAYGHEYDNRLYPVNDVKVRWSKMWRLNAFVKPGRESLNVLICNEAPTLAQVNAARNRLSTEQVGIYSNTLPALTQAQLDAQNAANDTWNTRVSVNTLNNGEVVSTNYLLNNESVATYINFNAANVSRTLDINSPTIKGMSFDLDSIKYYGGLEATDLTIVPATNKSITLTSKVALSIGEFLTINVLRDNQYYGTLFVNQGTAPTQSKKN